MNWGDVKKAFNERFALWTDISDSNKFGIENSRMDIPDGSLTWVRMTLRFGKVFDGEVGGVDVQGGIVFFDVFTPIGTGDVSGLDLCDSLKTHFKNELLTYGDGKVSCNKVDIKTIGSEDLFHHNQVQVNFINFIE